METTLHTWSKRKGWEISPKINNKTQLLIFFAAKDIVKNDLSMLDLEKLYPNAEIVGCSSAGEIFQSSVQNDSLVLAAIQFASSSVKVISGNISHDRDSLSIANEILEALNLEGLKHIMLIADPYSTQVDDVLKKINLQQRDFSIAGALAADGFDFKNPLIYHNSILSERSYVAVGFYGNELLVTTSSHANWKSFGPKTMITKAENSTLYATEDVPIYSSYKDLLGPFFKEFMRSALHFPLCLYQEENNKKTVFLSLILGSDNTKKSVTLANNIRPGDFLQFSLNNENLILESAATAAKELNKTNRDKSCSLVFAFISLAHREILEQLENDEISAINDNINFEHKLLGLYDYAEIGTYSDKPRVQAQTVTLLCLSESGVSNE